MLCFRISLLARSGLSYYWRREFSVLGNDCMYPLIVHAGDVKKIDVKHMTGSLMVLAKGLAAGLFVLLCELVYHHWKRGRIPALKSWLTFGRSGSAVSHWDEATNTRYTAFDKKNVSKAKLQFIHPKTMMVPVQERWNNQRPRLLGLNLPSTDYDALYSSPAAYNTDDNFQYYTYDGLKPGIRPKF